MSGCFFVELFCGLAAVTLSLVLEKVPCMCPWDSTYGPEFNVLDHAPALFALAKAGRIVAAHLGLPCHSLTWARCPQLRSWDHVWGIPGLTGASWEKVEVGNQLLWFATQMCFTLHSVGAYFSLENPHWCWTWSFSAIALVHDLHGVATVLVYYDQFGASYAKPTLFLHNLPHLHRLQCRARRPHGNPIVLRGQCFYEGEWRWRTSLASPYPPELALEYARLVRQSLEDREQAVLAGTETPMAKPEFDYGLPLHMASPKIPPIRLVTYDDAFVASLKSMYTEFCSPAAAESHFAFDDEVEDLEHSTVPWGVGAPRGLTPPKTCGLDPAVISPLRPAMPCH